jgi:hypothetical protein
MKRNKIFSIVQDDTEIDNLKKNDEYQNLENFYNMMTKENLENNFKSQVNETPR